MPISNCHLCGTPAELQNSHIIPAFVFRWLRNSSGSGHLRSTPNPNRRIQDGPKDYWLCQSCEANFSCSEKAFAQNIFHPYLNNPAQRLFYGPWFLHFCVSVSWRNLHYHMLQGATNQYESNLKSAIERAELTWRNYLLRKIPHPREFRQHFIPTEKIDNSTITLHHYINRFLMRTVYIDLCKDSNNLFTLTKIGRFIVIGFIGVQNERYWSGSRVNANKGTIEPRNYTMPANFMGYINAKADSLGAQLISDQQRANINNDVASNPNRMTESDDFAALSADIEMFGSMAFYNRQDAQDGER